MVTAAPLIQTTSRFQRAIHVRYDLRDAAYRVEQACEAGDLTKALKLIPEMEGKFKALNKIIRQSAPKSTFRDQG